MTPPTTTAPKRTRHIAPVRKDKPLAISIRGSRATQEDRFLLLRVERKTKSIIPERGWLMAVMDGHGGAEVSQAVEEKLPGAFLRAFKECHGQYKRVMSRAVELLNEDPQIKYCISAGTTLSMVYTATNLMHLYVAHLGDSPVVVFDTGGHILFRTEEHNIITNPDEVEVARKRSIERHGEDRVAVAEGETRSGRRYPKYIKDRRMTEDFEVMSQEILDVVEQRYLDRGEEYPLEAIVEDGKALTRIMNGKGVQNIAQLGAFPFDGILCREPDVAEVLLDPNRLPAYVLLATDGILDILPPGAAVHEVEKEIARLVAVEGLTLEQLVERAGGDDAHDNITVLVHKIDH